MQPESQGLFNVSYSEKEVKEEIEALVGKPYSFLKSLKMGGIGSPRMIIKEASPSIAPWMETDKYIQYCNIEIRPNGVIVRFRSRLDALAFVVSFKDIIIKESSEGYSLGNGVEFLHLIPFKNKSHVSSFFLKLRRLIP